VMKYDFEVWKCGGVNILRKPSLLPVNIFKDFWEWINYICFLLIYCEVIFSNYLKFLNIDSVNYSLFD
jgi:hypothetical protein